MDYYVYLHRRANDGKVFYVGKGSGKRAYSKQYRNSKWKNIANKYDYVVEFIETGMQEWWAFELEKELIALYGRENLANMTDGGDGVCSSSWDKEARARMSANNPSKRPEVRAKLSANCSMKRPEVIEKMRVSITGLKQSKETVQKRIAKLKGKKRPIEAINATAEKNKKPIRCENGMLFASAIEAGEWIRSIGMAGKHSHIRACCRGDKKTAYGFTWSDA